jgi:hypothetical protein
MTNTISKKGLEKLGFEFDDKDKFWYKILKWSSYYKAYKAIHIVDRDGIIGEGGIVLVDEDYQFIDGLGLDFDEISYKDMKALVTVFGEEGL